MNFRHLTIFLAVCETGNMTRAAKTLYLAQPSVSQAIAELEKYYNARLFERLNHRLYLTAAGDRLRFYARQMLNLSEQAQKEIAGSARAGTLRIGASLTVGAYLLPDMLAAYRQRHPEIEVFTLVDNTGLVENLILTGQLDFGLVEGPVSSPQIVEEKYSDDRLLVIASPRHSLAGKAPLTIQDLNGQSFFIREAGSGTQAVFENAMQAVNVSWKTAGIYNNIEAVKKSVIANLGLAVVSSIAAADEIEDGKLIPLEVQELALKRSFNLIYHRQKYFSEAMRLFWEAFAAGGPGSQPGPRTG